MTETCRQRSDRRAAAATCLRRVAGLVVTVTLVALAVPQSAHGAVRPAAAASAATAPSAGDANTLEAAASRAGETGRKVATSLIALAFAIAAIVLTFKRDFKEAVGVFAVGIVAVLLVTPAGINVLRDTVALLFGNR